MIIAFILFLFGLIIGSFINALQYRIQEDKTMRGRSFCPDCKHQLRWYDLFPLFSWFFLSGKCRYCKKPISFQYPLIELTTGILFSGVGIISGLSPKINEYLFSFTDVGATEITITAVRLVLLLFIVLCSVLVALHDAKTFYVLSRYVYIAIIASIVFNIFSYNGVWSPDSFGNYFLPFFTSALIAAMFFFSLYFFSKGTWMGAGDAEIALLIGIFLGWPKTLIAFYFAFISGSIWGITKVYGFRNAKMKSEMPFGPFLLAGMFFSYIFGEQLFQLYVKIFI
jgi:prepilin signal peptidase PulO-like enzyme (type II secretory pathway)